MQREEIEQNIKDYVILACRETITDLDLIDTGLLLNSFEVEISEDYSIEIFSQNYYDFLDSGTRYIKPFNITEEIQRNPNFDKALEYLEELIAFDIEKTLENEE